MGCKRQQLINEALKRTAENRTRWIQRRKQQMDVTTCLELASA